MGTFGSHTQRGRILQLIRSSGRNLIPPFFFFFGFSTVAEEHRREQRIGLLSAEERQCMEQVVSQKLEQMQKRALAWEPEYTFEACRPV